MYYVVICPDKYCRGITIANKKHDKLMCRTCNKTKDFDKFKISYETEDHSMAVAARTKLLTQLNDDGPTFEEIKEQGGLENPGRVFEIKTPDPTNKNDTSNNKSPQEIVSQAVTDAEPATRKNIIDLAISNGVSESKAEKIVERLLIRGHAIENNNIIKLI